MTHPIRTLKRATNVITHPGKYILHPLRAGHDLLKGPSQPEIIPGVPQIDTARQGQDLTDQFNRRKGRLATIFGGNSAGAPSVGRTTLGGQ